MPPFVRLGQKGCWSDRQAARERAYELKVYGRVESDRPNAIPTQGSSEADGDQTERVISERVPAREGGARAPGMSEPREPGTTRIGKSWAIQLTAMGKEAKSYQMIAGTFRQGLCANLQ